MRLNSTIKQAILAAALKKAGIFDREAAIRQLKKQPHHNCPRCQSLVLTK